MHDDDETDDSDLLDGLTAAEFDSLLADAAAEGVRTGLARGREEGRLGMMKSMAGLNGSTGAVLDFVRKAFGVTEGEEHGSDHADSVARTVHGVPDILRGDGDQAALLQDAVSPASRALLPTVADWLQARYATLAVRYGDEGARAVLGALAKLAPADATLAHAVGGLGMIAKGFDPNEKRDESGEWTKGGATRGGTEKPLHEMTEEQAVTSAPDRPAATPGGLLYIADALRTAMEEAVGDPKDQCIACAYALKKFYPDAEVFGGTYHGEPHVIAKLAGHFIDVTADQFDASDSVQVLEKLPPGYRHYDTPDPPEWGAAKQWETQEVIEDALTGTLKEEARNLARYKWHQAVAKK